MANRSYLFSCNVVPRPDLPKESVKVQGLAEWNYEIPLAFRLLASADPAPCGSLVWDTPDQIAIAADYQQGVTRLKAFLSRIELPEAGTLIADTVTFLDQADNQNPYIVLECGELYEMSDEPPLQQNAALLARLQADLDEEVAVTLKSLEPVQPKPPGLIGKLMGKKEVPIQATPEQLEILNSLGLSNWSNKLYYTP